MNKPFIVAEMSANHNGSLDRAMAIIDAAKFAGADAIKLQTFTPEQMVGDSTYCLSGGPWAGRNLLSLYQEAHTPREWHAPLFERAKQLGIECFSTPFHKDDVDFLETFGCSRYKIASFEIVDLDLIEACARTGKPLVISTGMASFDEVCIAKNKAWESGARDITLLKCVSSYPTKAKDMNLETMRNLKNINYHVNEVGLSDHSQGIGVAVAAATLGASYIEKHFTLSRKNGGLDAAFSMEPQEFAQMVYECRRAVAAIGYVRYGCMDSEESSKELRRSLFFACALPKGAKIERHHLKCARPALGMAPSALQSLIGHELAMDVHEGVAVKEEYFL